MNEPVTSVRAIVSGPGRQCPLQGSQLGADSCEKHSSTGGRVPAPNQHLDAVSSAQSDLHYYTMMLEGCVSRNRENCLKIQEFKEINRQNVCKHLSGFLCKGKGDGSSDSWTSNWRSSLTQGLTTS